MKAITLAAIAGLLALSHRPASAQIEWSEYTGKRLGWSVSVHGNYAIASAPFLINEDIRLYEKDASGTWAESTSIRRSEGGFHGYAVAASDDWLIFTDPTSGRFGHYAGGIYAWQWRQGRWQHYQGVFTSSAADIGTRIGMSLAHSDDVVAAGGMNLNLQGQRQSFVVVFHWIDGCFDGVCRSGWEESAVLTPDAVSSDDGFGRTLTLVGSETLFIGAPTGSASGSAYAGEVYEYSRVDDVWVHQQVIANPSAEPFARFGASIASSGDFLFVGSPGQNSGLENRGAVHVFKREDGQFVWLQTVTPEFESLDPQFGHSLVVAGDHLVVGSPGRDLPDQADSGSITMFRIEPSGHLERVVGGQAGEVANWVGLRSGSGLQSFGGEAEVLTGDRTGYTMAADGSTLILGLPHADSAADEDVGGVVLFDIAAISTAKDVSVDHAVATAITSVFPNPAERLVTVTYTLASPGEVTATLYNVLGQRVGRVLRGTKAAGSLEELFDVSQLPSGVYFVVLQTDDGRKVEPLTIR